MSFSRVLRATVISFVALGANSFTIGSVSKPIASTSKPSALHAVDVSSINFQDPVVIGAVGAALVAAVVASQGKGETGTSKSKTAAEPEADKPDLSIPYDAAARYAYELCMKGKGEPCPVADWTGDSYKNFKEKYEEMAVSLVKAKKLAREADEAMAKAKKMEEALSIK